jgi:K+-sensing histidine kinase KdpD
MRVERREQLEAIAQSARERWMAFEDLVTDRSASTWDRTRFLWRSIERRPLALRWLTVLLTIGIATLLGLIFQSQISVGSQLMLYLPAIFVSALYGGWIAGVAAAMLGAAATIKFQFPQTSSEAELLRHFVALGLYVLASALVIGLSRLQELQNDRVARLTDTLETRVLERTKELQAAHDELAGFCYSISHDLRAPMRNIVGSSRILLEEAAPELDEDSRKRLNSMAASANKLSRLVDDLLGYARLSDTKIQPSWIDLTKLAEELCAGIRPDAGPFTVVNCSIEPGLIAGADPTLLPIAIRHLLQNAAQYAKPDQPLEIAIGESRFRGHTWFTIRDNGIGFDMAYAHKIFEPFQRLHRDTEVVGTGIGLANVKRIIDRHGGEIFAESTPGEGTTIFFSLGGPEPTGPKPVSKPMENRRVLMADEA